MKKRLNIRQLITFGVTSVAATLFMQNAQADGPLCAALLLPQKSNVIAFQFGRAKTAADETVERNINFVQSLINDVQSGAVLNERQNTLWQTYEVIELITQKSNLITDVLKGKVSNKKMSELEEAIQTLDQAVQETQLWEQVTKKGLTLEPGPGQFIKAKISFEEKQNLNTAQAKLKYSLGLIVEVYKKDLAVPAELKALNLRNENERAAALDKFADSLSEFTDFLNDFRTTRDIAKMDLDQVHEAIKEYEAVTDEPYVVQSIIDLRDNALPPMWKLAEKFEDSVKKARIVFSVFKNPEGRPRLFSIPKGPSSK